MAGHLQTASARAVPHPCVGAQACGEQSARSALLANGDNAPSLLQGSTNADGFELALVAATRLRRCLGSAVVAAALLHQMEGGVGHPGLAWLQLQRGATVAHMSLTVTASRNVKAFRRMEDWGLPSCCCRRHRRQGS